MIISVKQHPEYPFILRSNIILTEKLGFIYFVVNMEYNKIYIYGNKNKVLKSIRYDENYSKKEIVSKCGLFIKNNYVIKKRFFVRQELTVPI